MPALSVSIDGKSIATVCTDGYDVAEVRVSGTRIDEALADLDVSGGSYPDGGESTYLMWVSGLQLSHSQVVVVTFSEEGLSSHKGKTIDEQFPDEGTIEPIDFKPTEEMFKELRAKPKFRDKFSFKLESSVGTSYTGHTAPDDHGFSFSVLWNSFHPERARLSLHSYTLDGLEARSPMSDYVEERMQYGDSVRFELVA